jgi:PilZ domain
MKNHPGARTMLRVLICSQRDLRPELAGTLVGRQGIEVYRVEKFGDARLVGSSLGVQVILVDRDLADAAGFIRSLRREPGTRDRSIAVLIRGAVRPGDQDLITAGANGLFRMPPDAGWDERFSKLLSVPVRQQARMEVLVKLPTELGFPAAILNVSPGGMLVATDHALRVGEEFRFRLPLPSGVTVIGQGRVARDARPTGFGVEFLDFDEDGAEAVQRFLRSLRLE